MDLREVLQPCYYLTASESARLQLATHGGEPVLRINEETESLLLVNCPVAALVYIITATQSLQVIDATGIAGNIDLVLNINVSARGDMVHILNWPQALAAKGLHLVEGQSGTTALYIKNGW
ncbi:hypothetical protein [Deminuibacter soli]|uniref:Uncharacterized protein n=1 Tax=Deminuibacter soli TaxID=2291815 RepID=A0A3E1NPW6_9BACT|nr:hypothetical protein [Deminuibacter soli]RFM29971.1 hypothetical protein DXN05_03075 [Deminuibacter soli]